MKRASLGQRCDLLVVSHNRPARLRTLLSSLLSLPGAPVHRVIVVDDSRVHPDWSSEFTELSVRAIYPERRVYISEAKNEGLGEVDCEVVLVIDDDNRLRADSFGDPLSVLENHPAVGAVMPSVLYHARPDLVWVYATPLRPSGWEFDLVGRNQPRSRELEGRLLDTDALPNAAFFRTKVLHQVGGWNPELAINSSADMCERIHRAGYRTVAATGAFVEHAVETPEQPGYWAAHAVEDPERCYFEIRDWFVWQRARHGHERNFVPRAAVRAGHFVLPLMAGVWGRPEGGKWRPSVEIVRGYVAGVRAVTRRR